jgi:tetratricopeptide (TPR) repeat protein
MGETEPAVHGHPDFDPSRLTVPVLYVGQADGLSDTFPYADRVSAVSDNLPATAVSYYGLIQALGPGADSTQLPQMIRAYQQVCRHVHDFLAWQFESDPEARARITGKKTDSNHVFQINYTKAEPRPPTADELLAILQTRGAETAKEILDRFALPTQEHPILTEAVYNVTGYQFLQRGDPASAMTILHWATIIAPGSANAWDSYAEACLAAGDRETALSASRRSLELIPTDSTSGEALLNILRETVPQRISDLEAETN